MAQLLESKRQSVVSTSKQILLYLLGIALFLVLCIGCRMPKSPDKKKLEQGLTFIVGSDLHFGNSDSTVVLNRATVQDIVSNIDAEFPDSVGGGIIKPEFIVFTGDLTDSGKPNQWVEFESMFGINGDENFPIPVYEGFGNHDGPIKESKTSTVREGIKFRNIKRDGLSRISADSLHYSWDLNEFHFVNLNSYPGNEWDSTCDWCHYFMDGFREPSYSLDFLIEDLEKSVGISGRPVILFFHYGFDEWGNKWWTHGEQEAFYEVIKEYNIAAIFHGHTHGFDYYKWRNIPVWCVGATQHEKGKGQYLVVRLKNEKILALERTGNKWGLKHQDSYLNRQ